MRWFHLLALWGVVGCVPTSQRPMMATCDAFGGTFDGVSFSDEQATNVIDMVDNATAAELSVMDGVDADAVRALISRRPFAMELEPLVALAELPAVQPETLIAMRDASLDSWCFQADGRQNCCMELSCDGLGGWAGSVSIDDAEAHAMLEWANNASLDELEAVCGIGPGIAQGLVDARPLQSVYEVDDVPYVGATTLQRILGRDGFDCLDEETLETAWCAINGNCTCLAD